MLHDLMHSEVIKHYNIDMSLFKKYDLYERNYYADLCMISNKKSDLSKRHRTNVEDMLGLRMFERVIANNVRNFYTVVYKNSSETCYCHINPPCSKCEGTSYLDNMSDEEIIGLIHEGEYELQSK